MVMTVLEGRVPPEKVGVLRESFRTMGIGQLPPHLKESFLVQRVDDPEVWRIMTVWKNKEDLEAYRKSGETPTGVLIFRKAGAEPTLRVFSIAEHGQHGNN